MCPLFIFIIITGGNLIQGILNVFLWDIHLHKRDINVITIRQKIVSADVRFVETKNYFRNPYLQGETSFMEDKDTDLFLPDISTSSPSSSIPPNEPSESNMSTPSLMQKDKQTQSATRP